MSKRDRMSESHIQWVISEKPQKWRVQSKARKKSRPRKIERASIGHKT